MKKLVELLIKSSWTRRSLSVLAGLYAGIWTAITYPEQAQVYMAELQKLTDLLLPVGILLFNDWASRKNVEKQVNAAVEQVKPTIPPAS